MLKPLIFVFLSLVGTLSTQLFTPANECVRSPAAPIVKKAVFPNTHFKLQADSISGIETVLFKNGDKLKIRNWGCEDYILTFRFETSHYKAAVNSLKYWYVAAINLMKSTQKGLDAPMDFDKALKALNAHISKNVFELQLKTEIDFGGNDIREIVTLDEIERLSTNRFAVTITFAVGPL